MSGVWSPERAHAWVRAHGWSVGCNFFPASAVNPLEMWQAATFDVNGLDRELGLAASLGMNTVRTNLHFYVWRDDPDGLIRRIDTFLALAARHGIVTLLNHFDDCMHSGSQPQAGPQPDPVPGVHNSRWVPSPPHVMITDRASWTELERFVRGTIRPFARDPRILGWDLYNEPGNGGMEGRSLPLVEACFAWARAEAPDQPLTMGVWTDQWPELNQAMLAGSDVISFHNYNPLPALQAQAAELGKLGRPLWCTEWMARTRESRVETHLPWLAERAIGCWNWGLVSGRTQTIFPWGTKPGTPEPALWFHDLFRPDGTPYRQEEAEVFRRVTGRR